MVSSKLFLTLISTFSVLCLGVNVQAGMEEDCENFNNMITAVQKQVELLKSCATEMGYNTPAAKMENNMCIIKCAMTKIGVLDAGGNVDSTGIMKLIDTSIPESLKPKALELVNSCKDAAAKADATDTTCKSYEPMVSCAVKGIAGNMRDAIADRFKSGKLPAINGPKCTALGARVEAELAKLEVQAMRQYLSS